MGRAWITAAGWTGGARYESKMKKIEVQWCGSEMFVLDPGSGFFHPRSRSVTLNQQRIYALRSKMPLQSTRNSYAMFQIRPPLAL
jgi:hypothetical protein